MDFSVAHEVYVFFVSVLAGMAVGLIYDFLRSARRCSESAAGITDVEDIIFWSISVAVIFFAALFSNSGELRWYQFFGSILGGILYFCTLSKAICFLIRKIIEFFLKIFDFFCKILLTPLLFTYKLLYRSILFLLVPIFRFFKKQMRKIFRCCKRGARRTKTVFMKK